MKRDCPKVSSVSAIKRNDEPEESALIDTEASDLFMLEKVTRKLGLSIKKLNKKIKTVNSEEAPTLGVVMWSYKSVNGMTMKTLRTKSYESSFGSVSGAKVRYEACGFNCRADTFRKSGLCIGLQEKGNDAKTVKMRALSKFISKEANGLWAIRSQGVRENVTGQNAKPVTKAHDAPHEGLSIRWGSFSPRELARFKELFEKPIRLKPGWPDNEDMKI
ncbi:hypothetical protein Goklo_029169 [Gossypium klotzschianum]|uniref:Uncharacterized protein n=1 Tax=Gossypium klotzschianum TaxID=34286 RepID=A0A7J8WCH5_9ROSI|nr:hypothetical protein [Gossypium klotzschianum]